MRLRANYDSGGEDGPEFIRCVDGQQPEILEVWTFSEKGVARKVHPTACRDVGAGFVGEFDTDYLTPTWLRVPMFVSTSINGSVKWLGVPGFLRKDSPPWALNLLAPYANWGYRGSITSPKWGSGSGGIPTVFLSCVINPIVSFQFTTGGSLRTPASLCVAPVTISLWITACTACKDLPLV